MLRIRCFIALFCLVALVDGANEEAQYSVDLMAKFQLWRTFHGKEYNSHDERVGRLRVYAENDERIQQHNLQQPPPKYTLGHNAYSDMTEQEFAAYFKLDRGFIESKDRQQLVELTPETTVLIAEQRRALMDNQLQLPDFIDWRALGGVTEVKNQGACGACWAFSTTGAMEGAHFVRTGELVSLSEQNLLDCDDVDLGCNGGLMDNAFKFAKEGGLCSEADYPYLEHANNFCSTNCTPVSGTSVKTFVDVPSGNEKALLSAVAMQPVSVAIEGSSFSFQFYKDGVLTSDACGRNGNIDHGVLAVGYGTDLDTQEPYFLVKNSWGDTWGDGGYVKIGRKTTNQFGICSILKMASFPLVE
ncbi:hypothetical protein MPSEU_000900500 [Mayamaea pseudoterrestris]|nr:hypothetical protein MPSEU_000900500 [Mayamaea pseudoterrestris]